MRICMTLYDQRSMYDLGVLHESFGMISPQPCEPGLLAWHSGSAVDGTVNDTKGLGAFALKQPSWVTKGDQVAAAMWAPMLRFNRRHPHALTQAPTAAPASYVHITFVVQQTIMGENDVIWISESIATHVERSRREHHKRKQEHWKRRRVTLSPWKREKSCLRNKELCFRKTWFSHANSSDNVAGACVGGEVSKAPGHVHSSINLGEIQTSDSRWKYRMFCIVPYCSRLTKAFGWVVRPDDSELTGSSRISEVTAMKSRSKACAF